MTNDPTWRLQAIEDEGGATVEALLAFDDSDVAITVAAADLHDAVRRFADLINGWRKHLPEPDPDRVMLDTATIAAMLKGPSK